MQEKVRETRQLVFDLYMNFFYEGEPEWSEITQRVSFRFLQQPEKSVVFPETYKLIFDSVWATDKPGFLAPAAEIGEFTVWQIAGCRGWDASAKEFELAEHSAGKNSRQFTFFCRVLIEVDSEYRWDFDDEESLSTFNDQVTDPVFECFELDCGDLPVVSYFMNPYEFN